MNKTNVVLTEKKKKVKTKDLFSGMNIEVKKESKKRVYLVAPFFNDKQQKLVDTLKLLCEHFGFEVFSPKDDNLIVNFDSFKERQKAFNRNIKEVKNADFVLAVIDDWDCSVAFEMGIAYQVKTPILAYSNVMYRKLNLMMAHACMGYANGIEALKQHLKEIKNGTFKKYIWTG